MSENEEQVSVFSIHIIYNVTRGSILAPFSVSSRNPQLLRLEDEGTKLLIKMLI
jgi:hypothetical protein